VGIAVVKQIDSLVWRDVIRIEGLAGGAGRARGGSACVLKRDENWQHLVYGNCISMSLKPISVAYLVP
jgi:hypothetical protein